MHITQHKEGEQSVFSLVYEITNCVIVRANNKSKWNSPVTDTTPPPPQKKKKKKKRRQKPISDVSIVYTELPLHTSGVSDQRGGMLMVSRESDATFSAHTIILQTCIY